jgi:hypothetical protein
MVVMAPTFGLRGSSRIPCCSLAVRCRSLHTDGYAHMMETTCKIIMDLLRSMVDDALSHSAMASQQSHPGISTCRAWHFQRISSCHQDAGNFMTEPGSRWSALGSPAATRWSIPEIHRPSYSSSPRRQLRWCKPRSVV